MNDDKKIIKTQRGFILKYTLIFCQIFQQIKVGKKSDIQNAKTLIHEY